jgi:hypothetical protein
MAVFCDVAPCILVEIHRRLRGTYCLHHWLTASIIWLMEAVGTSETFDNFCQSTVHVATSQKEVIFRLVAVRT